MNWFVNVQSQVYGPYSADQMQTFVNEGRVNAQSLISNAPAQGFFTASGYDIFPLWAGSGQIAVGSGVISHATQLAEPSSIIPEAPKPLNCSEPEHSQSHVFVILAEIRSEGAVQFLQKLQNFGTPQRIGDTVWLVKSAYSVEQIRNTLSQCLNRQDRLFILDSAINSPAWFNIGADLDSRIREIFDKESD